MLSIAFLATVVLGVFIGALFAARGSTDREIEQAMIVRDLRTVGVLLRTRSRFALSGRTRSVAEAWLARIQELAERS